MDLPENFWRIRGALFVGAIFVFIILCWNYVVYNHYDVLLVCTHAKDHGEHMVFKERNFKDKTVTFSF